MNNSQVAVVLTLLVSVLSVGLLVCKRSGQASSDSVDSKMDDSSTLESSGGHFSLSPDSGFRLYGLYFFDSRGGGLSSLYRQDVEIVPPGASIAVFDPNYIIGFYSGSGSIEETDKIIRFQKIFFCIKKDGSLEFGLPYEEDPRVMGDTVSGRVLFDAYAGRSK